MKNRMVFSFLFNKNGEVVAEIITIQHSHIDIISHLLARGVASAASMTCTTS